ncbi:MAG: hypothetical protein ACI9G5_000951 [Paracoccaceae bacterium]|jgi:hypothetical protein
MSSMTIEKVPLPEDALLNIYHGADAFTDCYTTRIPFPVSHGDFIVSFYTTWLFKLERFLIGFLGGYPATDSDAEALASGAADCFSAWRVEASTTDQILLSDLRGRTRSWLMVKHAASSFERDSFERNSLETILYFGSAVVLVENSRTGKKSMGLLFDALSGFHKLYSVLLLKLAAGKLLRGK